MVRRARVEARLGEAREREERQRRALPFIGRSNKHFNNLNVVSSLETNT